MTLPAAWARFVKTELDALRETPTVQHARATVSAFVTPSAPAPHEKEKAARSDSSELLQAIEYLLQAAFAQNERKKPLHLRQAGRRASLWSMTAAVGLAGIVYGIWVAHLWMSPDGVVITYYSGTNFDHPSARRVCHQLFRDYETDSPAWGIRPDNWSARWEGYLVAPTDDEYAFYVQSMDGVRLFIDNQCLIDNWHEQAWKSSGRHASMRLQKGPHRLVMEHYNAAGPSAIRVRWTGGGIPANSIIETPYLRKP
jgi:hypothetical protein